MAEVRSPNLAETLAKELKQPIPIDSPDTKNARHLALPPGWALQRIDDEALLPAPRRKRARVALDDAESFIAYVKRHGSLTVAPSGARPIMPQARLSSPRS